MRESEAVGVTPAPSIFYAAAVDIPPPICYNAA